ncbi:unnamed protein product [Sphagnum balticum]
MKIRVFCTRSYHALFMRNMLIVPTEQELAEDFAKGADIHIFNAGEMNVSKNIEVLTDETVCALNLNEKKMVILERKGGCYAKTINLTEEDEPEIYHAIKFGTIIENVNFYPNTREINYNDSSITQEYTRIFPTELPFQR